MGRHCLIVVFCMGKEGLRNATAHQMSVVSSVNVPCIKILHFRVRFISNKYTEKLNGTCSTHGEVEKLRTNRRLPGRPRYGLWYLTENGFEINCVNASARLTLSEVVLYWVQC